MQAIKDEEKSLQVKVFTTPACQPCRLTKMRFDKLGIDYQELPAEQVDKSLGYSMAPVVVVDCGDGATHSWSGFRPDRISGVAELLS